jgi:hypothetical protein
MATLVAVTSASADVEALFQQLVNYINSYGQNGVTMELRTNVQPGVPAGPGGAGPVNYPVNGFTNVGRTPNFVYVAPVGLVFTSV